LSRICLDTSAYSRFQRGEHRAVEVLDSATWVGVPAIVLGELFTGFMSGLRPADNDRELRAFLDHPVTEVLVVDEAAARIYAEIVAALRAAGTPLPTNDIWIAAVAARESATVVTFDRHFEAIRRVGVQLLT
jgi:tRNA(fMet)-specific endonuclease VapC